MRKLSENGALNQTAQRFSNKSLSKAVKVCGYVLFILGIATLFTVVQSFRIYSEVPVKAVIIAAAELAAGFMQIKCAGEIKFGKISFITDICAAAVLLIIIYINPDMLRLPALIGLFALGAAAVILIIRTAQIKK